MSALEPWQAYCVLQDEMLAVLNSEHPDLSAIEDLAFKLQQRQSGLPQEAPADLDGQQIAAGQDLISQAHTTNRRIQRALQGLRLRTLHSAQSNQVRDHRLKQTLGAYQQPDLNQPRFIDRHR